MTLLSIAIPSYNSESYLHYCVHSLVVGGDQVEILIINDGSSDTLCHVECYVQYEAIKGQ